MTPLFYSMVILMMLSLLIITIFNLILLLRLIEMSCRDPQRTRFKVLQIACARDKI